MTTVLISGAGVAGLTLAHWLSRHGFNVTVVEQAPQPRTGGQAVDVRAAALQVLDQMGILQRVAARATATRGMSIVDADGAETMRDTTSTLSGGAIDSPDIEILRDDLIEILTATAADARLLFDEAIVGLDIEEHRVVVELRGGDNASFDLVVGADGLYSAVRRLAFDASRYFIRRLGIFLGICTAPNFLDLDHWQVWYRNETTNSVAALMSVRHNTEARALLGFTDPDCHIDYRDRATQFDALERRFDRREWVTPQLISAMRAADDFYFDEASQVIMDTWSNDRVALVGDAAYCCSPVGGQGTTAALIGSYTLAGELARAGRGSDIDYRSGFANYQRRLHRYVDATQSLAYTAATGNTAGATADHTQTITAFDLTNYP